MTVHGPSVKSLDETTPPPRVADDDVVDVVADVVDILDGLVDVLAGHTLSLIHI